MHIYSFSIGQSYSEVIMALFSDVISNYKHSENFAGVRNWRILAASECYAFTGFLLWGVSLM